MKQDTQVTLEHYRNKKSHCTAGKNQKHKTFMIFLL